LGYLINHLSFQFFCKPQVVKSSPIEKIWLLYFTKKMSLFSKKLRKKIANQILLNKAQLEARVRNATMSMSKPVFRQFRRDAEIKNRWSGKPSSWGLKNFWVWITLFSKNFQVLDRQPIGSLDNLKLCIHVKFEVAEMKTETPVTIWKTLIFDHFHPPKLYTPLIPIREYPRNGTHIPLHSSRVAFSAETKNWDFFIFFLNKLFLYLDCSS